MDPGPTSSRRWAGFHAQPAGLSIKPPLSVWESPVTEPPETRRAPAEGPTSDSDSDSESE